MNSLSFPRRSLNGSFETHSCSLYVCVLFIDFVHVFEFVRDFSNKSIAILETEVEWMDLGMDAASIATVEIL